MKEQFGKTEYEGEFKLPSEDLQEIYSGKKEAEAEIEIPELDSIDSILEESEKIMSTALLSEEEINDLLEKRFSAIEQLRDLDRAVKERLNLREEPLEGLSSEDYDRLVSEKIISAKSAENLKKIDGIIEKYKTLENPPAAAEAELERLREIKETAGKKIESHIEEKRREFSESLENMKNSILEDFLKKKEELEKEILKAEENPQALKKIQIMAESKNLAFDEEKKKKIDVFIKKINNCLQSPAYRHDNVFNRLNAILDDESLREKMLELRKKGEEKPLRALIDSVRRKVVESIIDGEGEKQIKSKKEIIPWSADKRRSSVSYFDSVNFLRFRGAESELRDLAKAGDERATKLIEDRGKVIAENEVLRMLIGKEWIVDKKTGKKKQSVISAAFEKRKENDKKGVTEERKKAREEAAKKDSEFIKGAEEIVARGGFIAREPIMKKNKGRLREVGSRKVVARVEKVEAKSGNMVWRIVELFGNPKSVRIGQDSYPDFRSFPKWFQEVADKHSLAALEASEE